MILKIFRAADAFLYLPTYVAEEYGIFETLLKPLGVEKVEFITSDGGDIKAVELMLEENNNSNKSIAIAIGDPTAFLSKRIKSIDIDDIRVVGAIINKLPFWAVNHVDKEFETIREFENEFDTVIHYKSNLISGFYLGNRVKNEARINQYEDVIFGEEIPTLVKHSQTKNKRGNRTVAITADIISLIKGITDPEQNLKINYRFSKEGNHLTTGIVTSQNCCAKYGKELSKISEAVQKSIALIYSSERIAKDICSLVSKKPEFSSTTLNQDQIIKIIDLINEEQFYPADLNISLIGWNEAIKALCKTEQWEIEEYNHHIQTSFNKYIDNTFILNSERSIANQFGINLETFKTDIESLIDDKIQPLMKRIELLETDNSYLSENKKYFVPWLSKISNIFMRTGQILYKLKDFFIKFSVISIVIALLIYFYKNYVNEPISNKEIFMGVFVAVLASVIATFIADFLKSKSQ